MIRRTLNRTSARGQTTLDFAFGVSIFLLSVIFVFAFVPSLFAPFQTDQAKSLTANRVADTLAQDVLLSDDPETMEPFVLDKACTDRFFAQLNGSATGAQPPDCRFSTSASSVRDVAGVRSVATGLQPTKQVNVTIEQYDSSGNRAIVTFGERYAAGDVPVRPTDSTAARRIVSLSDGGTEYRLVLVVRIWS